MAPPSGSACMSRPRAATRMVASCSVRTPATCAAAISPTECPARWSGRIPQLSSRRWRATSTANRAGCAYSVRCSSSASGVPGRAKRTSLSGLGSWRSKWAQTSSRASANAGCAAASSRPMPDRWLPCPVNRKPSSPPARGTAGVLPEATPVSAARSSALSAATRTARSGRAARVVARAWARSAGSVVPASGSRSAARARRAASPRADSGKTRGTRAPSPVSLPWVRCAASGSVAGTPAGSSARSSESGCSRMTCALVPLTPKEETPARRGRPVRGQGRCSVTSSTLPDAQAACGVGASTCRVAGTWPCRMARTVLITPATPAAAWVCPRLDLTEPSSSGAPSGRPCP